MTLYENIDVLKSLGLYNLVITSDVLNNLNSNFTIRDYQTNALCNYINYYEKLLPNGRVPRSFLFNMATGSGKTYVMAGCILYLYTKGYRNFVFFVNSTNLVEKTKENLLNKSSSKFLFNDNIVINGNNVKINSVDNFQSCLNCTDINIVFTTTQSLHIDLNTPKENAITWDDFKNYKICFISDESHHLYASTKKQEEFKKAKGEKKTHPNGFTDSTKTWEETVNVLLNKHSDNLMLEYTATCDIDDPNIKAVVEPKLGYVYALQDFYNDKYCKKIEAIEINLDDRILFALMINQYKQIIFANNRINIKPVVLFKTDNAQCKEYESIYLPLLERISGNDVESIITKYAQALSNSGNDILKNLSYYLENNNVSYNDYAEIIKKSFDKKFCLIISSNKNYQFALPYLNNLENRDNPYRVVFECKRLDEGWDVLNLFDIVRLYDTASAKDNKTILEAQLIGRGARYCPFKFNDTDSFKRKFDNELNNELSYCETIYYFCTPESFYLQSLKSQLNSIGLTIKTNIIQTQNNTGNKVELKDEFKKSDFYNSGFIYTNRQQKVSFEGGIDINSLQKVIYEYDLTKVGNTNLMSNSQTANSVNYVSHDITFSDIANKYNYNSLNFYFNKYGMNFKKLKNLFGNDSDFKSVFEFLTSGKWLGKQEIEIRLAQSNTDIPLKAINEALNSKMNLIIDNVKRIAENKFKGTKEFDVEIKISNAFKDYVVNECPISGSIGVSQNDSSCGNYQRDLTNDIWHIYKDNFGTSEEKKLVHEIATDSEWQKILSKYGHEIFLIRNEEVVPIYAFDDGAPFYPDYILVARKFDCEDISKRVLTEQIQIFIEPKGENLIANDKWKQDFLIAILNDRSTHTGYFATPSREMFPSAKYKIFGVSFYNRDDNHQHQQFKEDIFNDPKII